MSVTVVPSVFQGPGRPGDFTWMVEQPNYAHAFFIFNDNESQFRDFHDHETLARPTSACTPGAGNGAMRPWQCESPPRAGGIPTGDGGLGYPALTEYVRSVIDRAVAAIEKAIEENGYTEVYFSSDETGGLGAATFNPSDDVRAYIVAKIRGLARE